jgi:hypothetical protein
MFVHDSNLPLLIRVIYRLKWFRIVLCFGDWLGKSQESYVSKQTAFQRRGSSMHCD